jgi:hypothetical protein
MITTSNVSEPTSSPLLKAVVDVTVNEFRDIFEASGVGPLERGTPHSMAMRQGHPQVSIDSYGNIAIKPYGATLEFVVSEGYYPIGIAFKLLSGVTNPDDEERLGQLNFSQLRVRPENHSLSVTDEFKDLEGDNRYKFSILIQRGSDGQIGIIDPGIVHQPR